VQVVVARPCNESELSRLELLFPTVRFVAAPADVPAAQLRVAGMRAASGDVVKLLDDGSPVPPGWLAQLGHAARASGANGETPAAARRTPAASAGPGALAAEPAQRPVDVVM
jgi:hypothetical protein